MLKRSVSFVYINITNYVNSTHIWTSLLIEWPSYQSQILVVLDCVDKELNSSTILNSNYFWTKKRDFWNVLRCLFNQQVLCWQMRSLKWQVLEEVTTSADAYNPYTASGHKRRMYFLLCMSCLQPVLMWWLSAHLVPPPLPPLPPNLVNP